MSFSWPAAEQTELEEPETAEETRAQIQAVLGEDFVYTPEHWGYYITDESVAFFYYDPRFWDQVATKRVR